MSSTNTIILDTIVLEVMDLQGPDRRNIHEIHIAHPDFQFRPGQFVMVKKNCGPTSWAYPYMIQQKTGQGFTVWAVGKSSLADAEPGLSLTVWGANGRPVGSESALVVCEAATWFLAAPVFNNIPGCRALLLNPSGDDGYLSGCGRLTSVRDISQMAVEIARRTEGISGEPDGLSGVSARQPGSPSPQIIAALNIPALLALVKEAPQLDTGRLSIFAGTKISCGVNGCKSCYLHSRDLPLGISVCCNGPYLPFDKVDFELDQRCFYTFD